ncbi:hypothetical protein LMG33818_001145 [Halomonadaceae bacterium LMG 33818]|uniref:DUF1656 domain-containing protein n=1 Tax=Cernens ardua TaxID=3402176 RepID=UPI003EDC3D07
MYLHELSWNGVYFSPMIVYAIISLVISLALRILIYKLPIGRFILQEAWFDVALFMCVLVGINYLAIYTPSFLS